MEKIIEIPEGYEARIEGNKVVIEPKESEDERIRKDIIAYMRYEHKSTKEEIEKRFIPWLEKQKDERKLGFAEGKVEGVRQTCQEIKEAMSLYEPKDLTPFESTFREYIDSAIRYCLSGDGYQQFIKEWAADLLNLEKQKEQKPVLKFRVGDLVKDTNHHKCPVYKIIGTDKECYICESSNPTLGDKVVMHFTFDNPYLRLVEQKPAEWSEEDEGMLNCIIATLCEESHGGRDTNEKMVDWLDNKLKFFSPRPHWKPSNGQMAALYDALYKYTLPATLQTLYDDLKKLM